MAMAGQKGLPMTLFEEIQPVSGAQKHFCVGMAGVAVSANVVWLAVAAAAGGSGWSRAWLSFLLASLLVLAICILSTLGLRLKIRVGDSLLRVQVWPLPPAKKIPTEQIRSARQRTVKPLREFGGWGIRARRGHLLYSLGGNDAVTVEYLHRGKDRQLTITTERGDELVAALSP